MSRRLVSIVLSLMLVVSMLLVIPSTASAVDSGEMLDGAKVYYLDNVVKTFNGPAMGEDLDVDSDGKIVTLTESASNKYIFGKFFFANKIVSSGK